MNRIIKGLVLILLLGFFLFYFLSIEKKESVALTPEELVETIKSEQVVEHNPLLLKASNPIFNEVESLVRLEFYKLHAIARKKILMVYFYSNGCYYCEKMKNITFADSRVQEELNKHYIAVSVNYSAYKHIFKKAFHLRATPAIVFFDKEGQRMEDDISYGYQGAEDFYNKIQLLAEPF